MLIFDRVRGAMRISAAAALAVLSAIGQETVNNASVSGRVTDPSGAVVEGALVWARQVDTNLASSLRTDRDGRFRFPYLRVGRYIITVQRNGFAETARSINLTVGAAFALPIQLNIQTAVTSVSVDAAPPVLEEARSQIAGTISQQEVRSLPLNGRNFLDLALVVPGVSPTNTASTQLFPRLRPCPVKASRSVASEIFRTALSSTGYRPMMMPQVLRVPSTGSMLSMNSKW